MTTGGGPAAPGGVPGGLDVGSLLTIDVAAELRKLSQAQLEGAWQVPAELVRRAIRSGARRVEVSFRGGVTVADDGPGLDPALVAATETLLDQRRPPEQRHRAFAALEAAGEASLLALLGLPHLRGVSFDRGGDGGAVIAVRARGLDRRRAVGWLTEVTRFAPATVLVEGRPVRAGFGGVLIEAPLAPPLEGGVALTAQGDTAHVYLLAHGLVTAHVSLPGTLEFEAAVELGAAAGEPTPARLRDAVSPHVPALIDQAAALIGRLAPALPNRPEAHRARLARLALQALRARPRSTELERVPLFRTVSAAGRRLVSLAELRQLSGAHPGAAGLPAIAPGESADRHLVADQPVLVADEAERSLLAEALGAGFRAPEPRSSAIALGARLRRLASGIARLVGAALAFIRHPGRPRELPEQALRSDERQFLLALRQQLRRQGDGPQPAMCEGQGPLRRRRRHPPEPPILLLPRGNATVRACVRAYAADPSWMRMIELALLGDGPV